VILSIAVIANSENLMFVRNNGLEDGDGDGVIAG